MIDPKCEAYKMSNPFDFEEVSKRAVVENYRQTKAPRLRLEYGTLIEQASTKSAHNHTNCLRGACEWHVWATPSVPSDSRVCNMFPFSLWKCPSLEIQRTPEPKEISVQMQLLRRRGELTSSKWHDF